MIVRDRSKESFFEQYGSSKAQVWAAVGKEAYEDNPEQLAERICGQSPTYSEISDEVGQGLARAISDTIQKTPPPSPITEEEFKATYPNAPFIWDKNMTHAEAEHLKERHQQREANHYLIAHGKGGFVENAGSVVTAVGASLLSPANLALSMIPIGGQARWAQLASKIGKLPATALQHGVSGGVFQMGMEPLIQAAKAIEQSPMDDATEIVKHVGIGALMGAGFGVLGYGASKLKEKYFSSSSKLHPEYETGNPTLDAKTQSNIKAILQESHPKERPAVVAEDIESAIKQCLEAQKVSRDTFAQDPTLKPLFDVQDAYHARVQEVHEAYATGGKVENLPQELQTELQQHHDYLTQLEKTYGSHENYQLYQKEIEGISKIFGDHVRERQYQEKGYDLSKEEMLIGRQQIDDGKHLDLDNPSRAESIFESERMEIDPKPFSLEQQYQDYLEVIKTVFPENDPKLSQLGARGQEAMDSALKAIQEGKGADIHPLLDIIEETSLSSNPKEFTNRLKALVQHIKDNPGISPHTIQEMVNTLSKEYQTTSFILKRNEVLNMKRQADCWEIIEPYKANPFLGFKHLLRTVDTRQSTTASALRNNLYLDLERANLVYVFKDRNYAPDIARELHALSGGGKEPGHTGSKKALHVATIIHKWQSEAVKRANLAGAHIETLPGYITRQMHNPKTLGEMGLERWKETIIPLLTPECLEEVGGRLNEIYSGLLTGKHLHHLDEFINVPHAPERSSVATAISASRKLHFKDADSWIQYNELCGVYPLGDSVLSNLEKIGSSIGLLETLGTRPEDTFQNLKTRCEKELTEKVPGKSKKEIDNINKIIRQIDSKELKNELALILGHNAPDNPTMASYSQAARALKTMSSLGSVLLSCFPDMVTFAVEQQTNGINIFKSYFNILKGLGHSFTSKEKKAFVRGLGVTEGTESISGAIAYGVKEKKELGGILQLAIDHMLGSGYTRLNAEHSAAGGINKATNVFFKLNALEWWDTSFKSAMGLILSKHVADHVVLPYHEAPTALRKALAAYGIEEPQWALFRQCIETVDGHNFISPEKVRDIHPQVIADLLEEIEQPVNETMIHQTRTNLEEAFRGYLLDRVDTACPTPHAAERALVSQGLTPGTPIGEAWRFIMQFKSFPVTFVNRALKSITVDGLPKAERTGKIGDVTKALSNPQNLMIMSQLLIGTSVMGYVSICAKKMLMGEEIPDIDTKTVAASFIKGGGLGLYGDFLFGEYSRYGRSLGAELAGPIFGVGSDIYDLYQEAKNGKFEKVQKDALKFFKRNTPGQNLFYLEPIMALFG